MWRIYNEMYVRNADAMVPYFPRHEEMGLSRGELDIML